LDRDHPVLFQRRIIGSIAPRRGLARRGLCDHAGARREDAMDVKPIAGALGAEIVGPDLRETLDDATVASIRQALLDHLVIFFRDQDLSPDQYMAFARRFGTPVQYPFVKGIDGHPEIIRVAKLEHETVNFGGVW